MECQNKLYYAGIGSRTTPPDVLKTIYSLAKELGSSNFTLRSGGAEGCDSHFEGGARAVGANMEIYLPWEGFNQNESKLFSYPKKIEDIAREVYGTRWNSLSQGAKKLMTRNVCQILGLDYTPVSFVVCYTSDGCESSSTRNRKTGGTGQAIDLASILDIPVFNIKNENYDIRLSKYLSTL